MLAYIIFIMFGSDWKNYFPANDESTCGEGKAKVDQRLTPLQNGLMVRVRW